MAVYTEVSFEELERLLQQYDIGQPLSFKGIAEGIENSNFYLQTDRGGFILTLYERRVASEDLPFFLGLMEHLADRGLHCPLPVKTRQGRTLVELNRRKAAIVTFLTGIALRRPDAGHCAEAAKVLAQLHRCSEGFALSRANALGPQGWKPLAEAIHGADTIEDGLSNLIEGGVEELIPSWPSGLPTGVIHADFFPDNVLFVGNQVGGVIDFYFACNDAYVYDLAIMLNSWCFELDGSYNITKGQSVINAYRAERSLHEKEIAALPTLMRGAALRFLLTRTYDWLNRDPNALVRPKDPREYAKKLRFHNKVRHAREYGL
jgi:homoserine kinase type II